MGKSTQSLLQIMAGTVDVEGSSNEYSQQRSTSLVSYDVFLNSYWKHFPQPLTKGLGALASIRHNVLELTHDVRSCTRFWRNLRRVRKSLPVVHY